MKKFFVITAVALAILCLAACGKVEQVDSDYENPEIAALFDNGYEWAMSGCTDDEMNIMLVNYESSSYMAIHATLTEAQAVVYEALDILDDDYDEMLKSFILSLEDIEIEDVSSAVPTQEELDAYVGMTVADLFAEGYEMTGYSWGEGEYSLFCDNGTAEITVTVEGGENYTSPEAAGTDAIGTLTIGAVSFNNLSANFFD